MHTLAHIAAPRPELLARAGAGLPVEAWLDVATFVRAAQ